MHDVPQIPDANQHGQFQTKKPGWTKVAAVLTTVIGLIVLCGWAFGIDALKRLLPGLVTMKANTAAAFVLSGICLYLQTMPVSPVLLLVRRIAAALVLLLGLATLFEYRFGWDIGIDQLLFSEPTGEILTSHPGRMSTITASNFALIGGALLLIETRFWIAAQVATLAIVIFALMPLTGYIFGNLVLTHIGDTTAIAAHTVMTFMILAAGVLAATRDHGFMVWLRREARVIGLAASLFMLVFIFGAATYNFVQKDKASQWVEHTYKVLQSMESYSDSMHDFLYHKRGFLITGDDRQLVEGDRRREAMAAEFVRMQRLVSDNPAQHERLNALDKLAQQRIEQADMAVQVWREKGPKSAVAMIISGSGEALTVEFEVKLNELREAERSLLKERQRMAEVIRASSLFNLAVLLAASILLLLWAFRASQREIVERRQTGEKLRVASLYARSLIEASLDPLVTISPEGKITDANRATEEATGIPRNELIGTDFSGYFTKPEQAQVGYRQVFDQGFVRDYPLTIRHQSGRLIDVLYNATVYRDEAGNVQGVFAAARDITERKRMEEEIAQREALFRNYFELGQVGMAITSLEKGWLQVNDRLCEMLGYRREELTEMTWVEMTHPDDLEPDLMQFRRLQSGEIERYSMDKRFIRKDGSVIYTYLTVSCQRKPDGDVDYVIASLQDITERKQAENELREKEERLALATIQNGVGVWDWNLVTQEMIWDDSMYSLYHIRREDFIGTEEAWRKALHPDDLHRGDQEVNDAIAGIRPFNTEFRVVWPGGEIRHIKAVAKVFRDEHGTPLRMLGINMDITERKRAEEHLRISEERLALAASTGNIGVWDWDVTKNILLWDDAMYRLYGTRREDFGGAYEAWVSSLHPEDKMYVEGEIQAALRGEREYAPEFRVIWPDGSVHYIKAASHTLYDDSGNPLRMVGINYDLTERKQTEEALRKSEEQFRAIFENAATGIARISTAGQFLEINEEFCRIIGYTREEVLSREFTFQQITFPEDLEPDLAMVNKLLDGGGDDYTMEKRYIRKDGSIAWVNLSVHLLRDNGRNPLYFISAVQDITERKLAENELREKEERLALATIQNGVGVWDWNLVTQEMIWDDSMYSLYHIRREDFIGTEEAWRKALHPDDLHRGDREVNDAIAGIKPFNTEFRVVWPNGEIHHIKAVAKVFRDEQGTPLRMLGINMDITERKQAEEALRASEERLHSIIQTSMDGIVQMDADGIVTGWNSQMEKVFGWQRAEAIGQMLHETIIPPRYREAHVYGLKHFLLTGEGPALNKRIEVEGLHRDGRVFPVELTVTPIKTGGQYEFSAFLRDISERKRQENIQAARLRLMESATRLSLKELLVATLDETCALTGSTIGFYHFLEADQKTLSLQAWSTRTTKEFCKAQGEGAHYNISEAGVWVDCVRERRPVIHNDYAALPHKRGMPPGHAHVEREMVVPIFRKESIVAILGVGNKATPYDDSDLESVTRLADIAWDIAEAKRAEEEVRRLNAELEQRVVERTASLQAANRDMESFSYSISHDLRAPLRAINGFSKILQEEYVEKLDGEGRRLLNIVGDNAHKMGQLIDDILAFSRAGRNEIVRSTIDMKNLTTSVWEELRPDMAGREVRLNIPDIPPAEGDPAMMHQVVFNLLSNAVKFTQHRPDARIEVGGHTDEHETVYYVKDNGVGFNMQYADKLFGVFQRLHGMDEFEGTGIGLAIVKRIVNKHGGRVWAEGRLNEGATIYFALPTGKDKGNLSNT